MEKMMATLVVGELAVQFIKEFTDCQSTWRLVWMSDLIFLLDFCGGLTL